MNEKEIRTTLLNEYRETPFFNDMTDMLVNRWDNVKGYAFFLNRSAVKCYKGFGLPPTLTWAERGRIAELSTYIQRDTNMLYYRSDRSVKPMDISHICDILDLSERGAYRFIRKMIDEGILAKSVTKCGDDTTIKYYINPIYYFCGHWLPPSLYMMFRDDLDRYLPTWVIGKYAQVVGIRQQRSKHNK